ncbi:MAG: diguanylate cyclase [Treponema sp.]|jgi:diguanylate cyclase (GGDEF)-like protein|nr:diguanylate cyclase [Treponema sp.]
MIYRLNSTIKYTVVVFSVFFFFFILTSGGVIFFHVMRNIIIARSAKESVRFAENKRLHLESRLNREIELTVRLAESPLVRHFFLDPDDPVIRPLGVEEILAYGKAFSSGVVSWACDADGRYYEGGAHLTTYDPDDAYHQWYPAVRDQKESFSLNIYYDRFAAEGWYLHINAPVREHGSEGAKGIGVVSNRIALTVFLSFLYGVDCAPPPEGELYLFNSGGEITAARDSALITGAAEKPLLSGRFAEAGGKIASEIQRLAPDSPFSFVDDNTQYTVIPIASLNWHMVVVRPVAFFLILGDSVTIVFAAMMGVVFLVFVVFNSYIFMLAKPIIILTGIMDTIFSITPNLLAVVDEKNRVIYMGKAMREMTDFYKTEKCEGKAILDLFNNEDMRAMLSEAIQQRGYFETIHKAKIGDKRQFFKVMANDIDSNFRGKFLLLTNVTATMMYGLTDPLTGLANRWNFDQYLTDEWKRAIRDRLPLSFLMMDLDMFKCYNDAYGHPQGDQMLKMVAGVIARAAKRPADLAVRMGGEEFGLLLPNTKQSGALEIAEHIRREVEKTRVPLAGGEGATYITISVGVACMIPTLQTKADALVSASDRRLYEAKEQGRNRVCPQSRY